jgi:hypothetical protein
MTTRRARLSLLLLLSLALAACRDGTPSIPAVGEQAVLACSDTCVAHGQCGRLATNELVVLANAGGPAVKFQDRFFPDGARVTLTEVNERELIAARNGVPLTNSATPFPHAFYLVQDAGGRSGWVSAWCIARPPN